MIFGQATSCSSTIWTSTIQKLALHNESRIQEKLEDSKLTLSAFLSATRYRNLLDAAGGAKPPSHPHMTNDLLFVALGRSV